MDVYFANTIQTPMYSPKTGRLLGYDIAPIEDYILRDNEGDWEDINGNIKEAYYRGSIFVEATYDFISNPREIEAVLEASVPADQIFGGGGNNHEVM
jgi:hypothetical protein